MLLKQGDRVEAVETGLPGGEDRGWIDIRESESSKVAAALAPLGWAPDLMAMLDDDHGHARIDRRGDIWFLSVYTPADDGEPRLVRVALAPHLLVTVHDAEEPMLDGLSRELPERPYLLTGAGSLLAEVCQRAADGFLGQVDAFEDAFDRLEDSVLAGEDRARDVFQLRRRLHALRLTMAELRRTAGQLARRESGQATAPDTDVFVDVYESLYHIIDNIDALRDNLTGLVDLQLNQRSMRLNEIMKFLTIFASIFLPITFITGFFGMNLRSMPELGIPFGQEITIAVMLLIAAVMLYIFRRKDWL